MGHDAVALHSPTASPSDPGTPAEVQLPCPIPKECSSRVKAEDSPQHPYCRCPRGMCSSKEEEYSRVGTNGITQLCPVPWAATLDHFHCSLFLETQPDLSGAAQLQRHPMGPAPRTRSVCPMGKGSGGYSPWCCSSGWQSRFPCLSCVCYLETSELPAPASAGAA